MQLNPELVKRSLSAHSVVGLVVGVLMYLICLTGTLAALAESFDRWEQPAVEEFSEATPAAVETAMTQFRDQLISNPESLWVVFPTAEFPRMHVAGDEQERFTGRDGSLGPEPVEDWTHMLRELHVQLHLPQAIGLILVSAVGAMLIALIVSGLLAHPRLFKDAFRLRLGGSRRLEQADIHNRLSVWALPFHLMIGVTGAFYGLVGLLVISAAAAWYGGDREALIDSVYGGDPVLEGQGPALDASQAMAQLKRHHPEVTPIYLVAHQLDTEGQFMEMAATVPGRLAYSEIYRFDAAGNYLGSQELTSGPVGRQLLYSLYRVHFGYFGGQWVRILWLVLGLALTVVSVSGINIWLAKRNRRDALDHAWAGFVWGAPLALTVSAFASVFTPLQALPVFLGCLAIGVVASLKAPTVTRAALWLQAAGAIALTVLAVTHLLAFPPQEFGDYLLWMNGGLLATALVFAGLAIRAGNRMVVSQALALPES